MPSGFGSIPKCRKTPVQSIFSIRKSCNDTRINASNVLSLLRSLSARILHVHVEFCLPSQNYRSCWNLEVYARVPRLEFSYVFICKLQPLYFATCNFGRGLHCEGWKLWIARFCEVSPPQKKKNFFDGKNGI